MLELDPLVVTALALGAVGLSVVLLVVVVLLALRLRRLRRDHAQAFGDADTGEVLALLGRHGAELDAVAAGVDELQVRSTELRELLRGSVSRVGLVRYDAFEDMGGALSFSAALLDERGDGIVISAINGRSETRCYVKPIAQGSSEHNLSAEESAAIDAGISGQRIAAAPTPQRRRRRAT